MIDTIHKIGLGDKEKKVQKKKKIPVYSIDKTHYYESQWVVNL